MIKAFLFLLDFMVTSFFILTSPFFRRIIDS
jgi:hypothetical protein